MPTTAPTEAEILQPIPIPQAPKPPKKLKPARKQVKPGDVVKEETVQTGKEYSEYFKIKLKDVSLQCIRMIRYLVQQMGRR